MALLGTNPLAQLLGQEQMQKAENQALNMGALNAIAQLLSMSGAQPRPIGTGQAIGQALLGGLGGYQSSMDRTLSDMAKSMQIQDMVEKQKREKAFRENVEKAYTNRPVGTGLTMSGEGSQQQMLLDQIQDFGQEGARSTVGALQSNVNLPQERALDQGKLMSAIAEYAPLEYAKLMATGEKAPEAIKTFEAFSKMNPEQQKQFLTFKASGQPQTNINLGEKIADKVVGERIGEFSSAAGSARRFAQDARLINDLLKGKGGGEVVKIGTGLAKDLGFANESVTAQDLANSIAIRGATTMRPAGSGSTSDIEFKAYSAAFPSLSNSEAGRQFMADAAEKFAERNAKLSDYAMKLSRDGKYSEEAISAYDKQLGSVLDVKELDRLVKSSPSTKSGSRRSY
jgi:hypothetical protein